MSESPIKLPYARAIRSMGGAFPALRYPNFRKWILGASVSVIGTWMSGMALAWLIYQSTGQNRDVALLGVCFQVPMALWLLPGGAVADRFDKRRLLITTQALLMSGSGLMVLLSALGWLEPRVILGLAVLRGSLMGFDMPARHAFVLEMVERPVLQSAVALNSASFNFGRVIGPALAGLLLGVAGPTWCFAIDAMSYTGVLTALLLIRIDAPAPRRQRSVGRLHDLKMGVLAAIGNRRIALYMALQALGVFVMAYNTLLPAMADKVFSGNAQLFGYLSAAVGAGATCGALTVSAFCRDGRQGRWVLGGLLLGSAGLVALSLATTVVMAMACTIVLGFAAMCVFSPANAAVQLAASERYRGRVVSLLGLVFILAMPLGAVAYGGLADWLHPQIATAAGAAVALLAALTLGIRVARTTPRPEPAQAKPAEIEV